jgi:hypothetical protein
VWHAKRGEFGDEIECAAQLPFAGYALLRIRLGSTVTILDYGDRPLAGILRRVRRSLSLLKASEMPAALLKRDRLVTQAAEKTRTA